MASIQENSTHRPAAQETEVALPTIIINEAERAWDLPYDPISDVAGERYPFLNEADWNTAMYVASKANEPISRSEYNRLAEEEDPNDPLTINTLREFIEPDEDNPRWLIDTTTPDGEPAIMLRANVEIINSQQAAEDSNENNLTAYHADSMKRNNWLRMHEAKKKITNITLPNGITVAVPGNAGTVLHAISDAYSEVEPDTDVELTKVEIAERTNLSVRSVEDALKSAQKYIKPMGLKIDQKATPNERARHEAGRYGFVEIPPETTIAPRRSGTPRQMKPGEWERLHAARELTPATLPSGEVRNLPVRHASLINAMTAANSNGKSEIDGKELASLVGIPEEKLLTLIKSSTASKRFRKTGYTIGHRFSFDETGKRHTTYFYEYNPDAHVPMNQTSSRREPGSNTSSARTSARRTLTEDEKNKFLKSRNPVKIPLPNGEEIQATGNAAKVITAVVAAYGRGENRLTRKRLAELVGFSDDQLRHALPYVHKSLEPTSVKLKSRTKRGLPAVYELSTPEDAKEATPYIEVDLTPNERVAAKTWLNKLQMVSIAHFNGQVTSFALTERLSEICGDIPEDFAVSQDQLNQLRESARRKIIATLGEYIRNPDYKHSDPEIHEMMAELRMIHETSMGKYLPQLLAQPPGIRTWGAPRTMTENMNKYYNEKISESSVPIEPEGVIYTTAR